MTSIKGHFDGTAVVLDEPASLAVGQSVRVVIEIAQADTPPSSEGAFKWDAACEESAALHISRADAVPTDFVRRPGSAAGTVFMSDDFNDTPEEFQDYL